jgi:hypothetical protein
MRFGNAPARHAAEVLRAVTVCLSEKDEASLEELAGHASRLLRTKDGAVALSGKRLTVLEAVRHLEQATADGVPTPTRVMWTLPSTGSNREIVGVLEALVSVCPPGEKDLARLLVETLQRQPSPIRDHLELSGAFRKLSDSDNLAAVRKALERARDDEADTEATVRRFLVSCGYPSELARRVFEFRDQATGRSDKVN